LPLFTCCFICISTWVGAHKVSELRLQDLVNQFQFFYSSPYKLVHKQLWTPSCLSELLIVSAVIKEKVIKKLYRCHSFKFIWIAKQNSLILEKSSFNSTIYISKETEEIVNEVLIEKKQLLRCTRRLENGVDKFCDGEVGLKIHFGRMHKNK
jgi:hypothetical protein